MTFLGRPTSLKTRSQSVLATPCNEISILMGIYLAIFEKQSTTTSTLLDPVEGGNSPTRSTLTVSQGYEGTLLG